MPSSRKLDVFLEVVIVGIIIPEGEVAFASGSLFDLGVNKRTYPHTCFIL
jgi:hypothetical protein